MNRCPGIKRDGSRCTVTVEPPQTYCWWHDPANAEARKQAASRGGKRAGRGRPQAELTNIKQRLCSLADDVLAGEVDRSDASVAGQLLNTVIRAIGMEMKVREVEELVEEVNAIKEALETRGKRGWYGGA
jgi:hypothetical protein